VKQPEKIGWVVDLGTFPYVAACDLQRRVVQARKAGLVPDVLLFCEHPHAVTLGRNGKMEHLRAGERQLAEMKVEFHPTDRGGDITYHGPGQVVGYPIVDMAEHRRDIRWYVQQLEEAMIRTSADFGVAAKRVCGQHGAWIDTPSGEEKLGALGVHLSRWVTSHGFAYNVSTDLRYFDLIVPCGIAEKRVTSLERALGRSVEIEKVRERLGAHFAELFSLQLVPLSPQALDARLEAAQIVCERSATVMV
jgi:lipoyl(octanoyl) transferase